MLGTKLAALWILVCLSAMADQSPDDVNMALVSGCDAGPVLSAEDRNKLFAKLRETNKGTQVLNDFSRLYLSLSNLVIQWDSVSYSQVAKTSERAPAAAVQKGSLGAAICVHLAKKLPEIEHVADLAHEITHATRLEMKVLRGEVDNVAEFVRTRLASKGGEADAFSVECEVKRELLGHWDGFCAPYAAGELQFDTAAVIHDLYNGKLSASLTGEAYPTMLGRQYEALLDKRAKKNISTTRYSGLENK